MKYPGMTIFLLFFGLSLLDAVWGGHLLRAAFWLAMALAIWGLERMRLRGAGRR